MLQFLAILAGFFQASVEYIRRILPNGTSPLIVATVISLTGGILGLLVMAMQGKWTGFSKAAFGFSALAGILVLLLDIVLVAAYTKGLKLNVGVPLFLGAAMFFGFIYSLFSGEKFSWVAAAGVCLIIVGSILVTTTQE